jgi:hypothetical protein
MASTGNEWIGGLAYFPQVLGAYGALTALVGDRIYSNSAPQGSAFPFVVFGPSSGTDRAAVGHNRRVMSEVTYLVKGVTYEEDLLIASRIARRIDEAINGVPATVTFDGVTYEIMGCHRETGIQYTEDDNGRKYNHFGGLYRLTIRTT